MLKQNHTLKNRMREIRSYGSVRGSGGNTQVYSEDTEI